CRRASSRAASTRCTRWRTARCRSCAGRAAWRTRCSRGIRARARGRDSCSTTTTARRSSTRSNARCAPTVTPSSGAASCRTAWRRTSRGRSRSSGTSISTVDSRVSDQLASLLMHVIFVEPAFPRNQREFPRALKAVGAKVTAIGESSAHSLDAELKRWLDGYEQVRSVTDGQALYDAVKRIQSRSWVDRIEATVEAHIEPVAKVREACSIPGTSTRTAFLCRDKPAMKEALRKAGIPCAQSTGTSSADEVRAFVKQVGFPVILKPRAAAGAAGTFRAG